MKTLKQTARRIFNRLEGDILDRRGLKYEWNAIDPRIVNEEIRPEWERIIMEEIKRAQETDL